MAMATLDSLFVREGGVPPGRFGQLLSQSDLIAGFSASAALLAFKFLGQIQFPLALALAIGVYFAARLLLPALPSGTAETDARSEAESSRVIAAGRACVNRLELASQRIAAPGVQTRLLAISRAAECILADFAECPRHVPEAQFVFQSLLDAAATAMDRQQKFEHAAGPAAERCRSLIETRVLPAIEQGLRQLHSRLLRDDLRAVAGEAQTLDALLELEGLTEKEQAS